MAERAKSAAAWTKVAFGHVVRQVKDRVDPGQSGLERYVAGEHMDTDDLRIRRWGEIGDGYLGPAFHMRFKPGHVLYGSRRTYLRKVAVADFEGITANTTYVLESKDRRVLLPELLPFIMQAETFNRHSVRESKGSVNPYVNFSDLAWYEFALPPIEEQRRIVEACTAVEGSLATLQELVEVARITWLATVQHFENLYAEHTTLLGDLLVAIEPGRSVVGSDRPPSEGEYGVLRVSAVDPLGFQPNESKALLDQADFIPEYKVRAGDLLITRANTPALVGESCIVDQDFQNLMLCDKTLRLVPRAEVSKNALWHMLQSNRVRQQILSVATGTGAAMKNVSQPKFRTLRVCLPPYRNVCEAIETRLDECRRALRECSSRRAACLDVRRTLLNQALGESAR